MKAIAIERFGNESELKAIETKTPDPRPEEVLIKLEYSGVNPVDWKIREGMLQKLLPFQFPIILGWDAAGTVERVGSSVSSFQPGDAVFAYCRKPTVQMGTYAEYIAFDADNVAPKPSNLSFAEAAGIPLVALTAWQALFDDANLKPNETVLIHAGAGGVGSMAIQFAKLKGAKIITTASTANHPYVKKLGADHAIDYTQEDFVAKTLEICPQGVDVVLDCAGHEALDKSFGVIKDGGRFISIVGKPDPDKAAKQNLFSKFTFVRPDGEQLREIGKLIETSKVAAPPVTEFPFSQAGEAHRLSQQGHTVGKIVLKIDH